jgi:LmbE family N-acetylglucosaminyl deacetylase
MTSISGLTAFAICAHPDDIEFHMAGTLLLLKQAGADIHMWNLANGCYGSTVYSKNDTAAIRWGEAQAAAHEAGATIYPPVVDDLNIFYAADLIARVASVIRRVQPDIILTHPPQDYMEDHMNTCRVVLSAAFTRNMPNYVTDPPAPSAPGDTVIYCAMPHSLRDGFRQRVHAGQYVNIESVLAQKRSMLAHHKSQKEWLDATQGMDSYLDYMEVASAAAGKLSGRFAYAEGWRRYSHQGYAAREHDVLAEALGALCWVDPDYEDSLNQV